MSSSIVNKLVRDDVRDMIIAYQSARHDKIGEILSVFNAFYKEAL